jgi:hypothetical protein
MGAANFNYRNRCVVVTDDDYECGNYPETGDYHRDALRSYPSRALEGYDFNFWDIVLTAGYYSGACIDYVEKNKGRDIYDYFRPHIYESVADFCHDLHREFPGLVSKSRIRKIFTGIKKTGWSVDCFIGERYDDFVSVAEAAERTKVEAAIDKIKEKYGYEEYAVSARSSNGEAWYSKVA